MARRETEAPVEIVKRPNRVQRFLDSPAKETFRTLIQPEIGTALLALLAIHSGVFEGNAVSFFPLIASTIYESYKSIYGEGSSLKDVARIFESLLLGLVAYQPEAGIQIEHAIGTGIEVGVPWAASNLKTVFDFIIELARDAAPIPGDAKDVYDNLPPESKASVTQLMMLGGAAGGALILRKLFGRRGDGGEGGEPGEKGIIRKVFELPGDALLMLLGAGVVSGEAISKKSGNLAGGALGASLLVFEFLRSLQIQSPIRPPVSRRDDYDHYWE